MKFFWVLLLSLLSILNFFSQKEPYKILPLKNEILASDIFNNIYVVDHSTILKLDSSGNLLNTFSAKKSGNIAYIDVNDPLKILVYYYDYNQIVFLSHNLTQLSEFINLDDIGITKVSAIASSQNGGIWLYDENKMQLLLLNNQLQILYAGTKHYIDNIFKIIEYEQKVYVGSKNKGIYEFDNKGNFIEFHSIKELQDFYIAQKKIFYLTGFAVIRNNEKILDLTNNYKLITGINNVIILSDLNNMFFYKVETGNNH
jgi:hypothetical protein